MKIADTISLEDAEVAAALVSNWASLAASLHIPPGVQLAASARLFTVMCVAAIMTNKPEKRDEATNVIKATLINMITQGIDDDLKDLKEKDNV